MPLGNDRASSFWMQVTVCPFQGCAWRRLTQGAPRPAALAQSSKDFQKSYWSPTALRSYLLTILLTYLLCSFWHSFDVLQIATVGGGRFGRKTWCKGLVETVAFWIMRFPRCGCGPASAWRELLGLSCSRPVPLILFHSVERTTCLTFIQGVSPIIRLPWLIQFAVWG